VIFRQL